MPSLAQVEDWIEDQWPDRLRDLPQQVTDKAHEYYTKLYNEIVKHEHPELQVVPSSTSHEILPTLQEQMPTAPPHALSPSPPSPSAVNAALGWARDHPITTVAGVTATSVGLGLAYALASAGSRSTIINKITGQRADPARRPARVRNGIRREAVVVLGADTPLGRALLISLTSQGLIVIAAVSSATSLKSFDTQLLPSSRGYVALRHFDLTSLPGSIDSLVAEIKSALAIRFPLNASGDPFGRPGDGAILIGIINVLSYVPTYDPSTSDSSLLHASASAANAGALLQRALSAHVTAPISAISALLPELRMGVHRIYSQNPEYLTPLTVLTLVEEAHDNSEKDSCAHIISESAISAALTLRKSALESALTMSNTAGPSRTLRFTVLLIPSALKEMTWNVGDHPTTMVTDKVANLILALDPSRPLPPTTRLPSGGPVVNIFFAPFLQAMRQAYAGLVAILPFTTIQWLEALYCTVSSTVQRVQRRVHTSTEQRHRRQRPVDGLRRSSTNSTIIKRDLEPGSRQAVEPNLNYLHGSTLRSPLGVSGGPTELDVPSSLETGSSADDDEILRSAPSSAFDEDDDHLAHSWLASSVAPTQSTDSHASPSRVMENGSAPVPDLDFSSEGSTPAASQHLRSPAASDGARMDQSWVQL